MNEVPDAQLFQGYVAHLLVHSTEDDPADEDRGRPAEDDTAHGESLPGAARHAGEQRDCVCDASSAEHDQRDGDRHCNDPGKPLGEFRGDCSQSDSEGDDDREPHDSLTCFLRGPKGLALCFFD